MSFWEVAPYWTYDNHSFMPDMILASKQTMDKLSPQDQQIIFDCAGEAEVWHRDAWEESEAKNAEIAREKGCILTTLTDDEQAVRREFATLQAFFAEIKEQYFAGDAAFSEISMGMSHDYRLALDYGTTMVRVGTLIFGERNY